MSAPQPSAPPVQPSAPAPLVDHLVARDGVPPRSGLAYDYVLAGDGLYLAAENAHLALRVPVARCAVRGLPAVHAACSLAHGRLPVRLWDQALGLARAMGAASREVLLAVVHDERQGYRLVVPDQEVDATGVRYRPPTGAVLELHSHHRLPARFSPTDDGDEQGLRLYGVMGRLDRPRPHVALRAGAYGHFLPVPWDTVFDGSPADRAEVHDVQFDDTDDEGALDADPAAGGADRLWLPLPLPHLPPPTLRSLPVLPRLAPLGRVLLPGADFDGARATESAPSAEEGGDGINDIDGRDNTYQESDGVREDEWRARVSPPTDRWPLLPD